MEVSSILIQTRLQNVAQCGNQQWACLFPTPQSASQNSSSPRIVGVYKPGLFSRALPSNCCKAVERRFQMPISQEMQTNVCWLPAPSVRRLKSWGKGQKKQQRKSFMAAKRIGMLSSSNIGFLFLKNGSRFFFLILELMQPLNYYRITGHLLLSKYRTVCQI